MVDTGGEVVAAQEVASNDERQLSEVQVDQSPFNREVLQDEIQHLSKQRCVRDDACRTRHTIAKFSFCGRFLQL